MSSSGAVTPNIGLQVPAFNQRNWNVPLQFNLALLDLIFGGEYQVPALDVKNLTIAELVLAAAQIINALGYTPLNPANNLGDVSSPAAALANLGGISPASLKGAWSAGTAYNYGNLVTYNGATYISIYEGAQSGNEPDNSPGYWELFLSASPVTPIGEDPAGAYPGTVYTLSAAPLSLFGVFLNGNLLDPATDYSINAETITLTNATGATDKVRAIYLKAAGSAQGSGGAPPIRETPAGAINGANLVFTLTVAPALLLLYQNGLLVPTANYALAGNTITFGAGKAPKTGAILDAVCY